MENILLLRGGGALIGVGAPERVHVYGMCSGECGLYPDSILPLRWQYMYLKILMESGKLNKIGHLAVISGDWSSKEIRDFPILAGLEWLQR